MNTVLGHNNFANGPISLDPAFVYINSGTVSATRTLEVRPYSTRLSISILQ